MLLSMHMTSVLFLVQFDDFAVTIDFYWNYTLLLKLPVLMHFLRSCNDNYEDMS